MRDSIETITYILCDCAIYDAERSKLESAFADLDSRLFTVAKVLGDWEEQHEVAKTTKVLVCMPELLIAEGGTSVFVNSAMLKYFKSCKFWVFSSFFLRFRHFF